MRTFRYVHAIGKDRLTNLQTHYKEKGVELSHVCMGTKEEGQGMRSCMSK